MLDPNDRLTQLYKSRLKGRIPLSIDESDRMSLIVDVAVILQYPEYLEMTESTRAFQGLPASIPERIAFLRKFHNNNQ
jgi:hypothetical protein